MMLGRYCVGRRPVDSLCRFSPAPPPFYLEREPANVTPTTRLPFQRRWDAAYCLRATAATTAGPQAYATVLGGCEQPRGDRGRPLRVQECVVKLTGPGRKANAGLLGRVPEATNRALYGLRRRGNR
jgi:hypothetical protein